MRTYGLGRILCRKSGTFFKKDSSFLFFLERKRLNFLLLLWKGILESGLALLREEHPILPCHVSLPCHLISLTPPSPGAHPIPTPSLFPAARARATPAATGLRLDGGVGGNPASAPSPHSPLWYAPSRSSRSCLVRASSRDRSGFKFIYKMDGRLPFLGRSSSWGCLTENWEFVGSMVGRRSGFGDFSSHLSTRVVCT